MKKIIITTDCVSDMPKAFLTKYNIDVMYYYVYTEEGRYRDIDEISSDNLIEYIEQDKKRAYSHCANIEEYHKFFGKYSEKGVPVIHICMARNSSEGFATASEASLKFSNIYVFDSGHLSGGMALMVLAAAEMAQNGAMVSEILDKLTELKTKISSSFIVYSIECLYRNGKIGSNVRKLCNFLLCHPVLALRNSTIRLENIYFGNLRRCHKKYIKKELKGKKNIDTRILFINFAGCSLQTQTFIINEVKKYQAFDKIVFQKASATISCNCGSGTFGLLYSVK